MSQRSRSNTGSAHRRAFTLVELVSVVVIVGVAAGLIVPRLTGTGARQERYEAEQVASIMTSFARRETIAAEAIGLEFTDEGDRSVLRVMLLDADEDGRSYWRADELIGEAVLTRLRVVNAVAEGVVLAPDRWRIEGGGVLGRPGIALELTRRDVEETGDTWSVVMEASGSGVTLVRNALPGSLNDERVVDLDMLGLGEAEW